MGFQKISSIKRAAALLGMGVLVVLRSCAGVCGGPFPVKQLHGCVSEAYGVQFSPDYKTQAVSKASECRVTELAEGGARAL